MFAVARELQPPHGVTHAVRGRFGPTASAPAAVFARNNSLDNYVVRASPDHARFLLLASSPLSAAVASLAAAKRPGAQSDLLAVAFDRMRLALLSWRPDQRAWRTDQLVDLAALLGATPQATPPDLAAALDPSDRGRPLLRGTRADDSAPLVRADPAGRCLAVLSRTHSLLYIIPLRTDEDDERDPAVGERAASRAAIFTIDLPSSFEAPNVKDFCFLHGTFDPALAVLHEPKRTWSGRVAAQKNTCVLLSVLVDLRKKLATKSWAMDAFPYDCEKVEAVPEGAEGGVLVISPNALIQVRHGSVVAGLSLNFYGDAYATDVKEKYDAIKQSDVLVECDAAHCRFLDADDATGPADPSAGSQGIALLSLKGGELYFVHVAAGAQSGISMTRAGSTVIASEIVPVNNRFFILSSRLSDSLLVEYKHVDDAPDDDAAKGSGKNGGGTDGAGEGDGAKAGQSKKEKRKKSGNSSRPKKRKRTVEEEEEYEMIYGVKPPQESSDDESDSDGADQSAFQLEAKDEGTRGVYDDEDELGDVFNADSGGSRASGPGNWALKVKDTLQSFGPGADITTGPAPEDMTQTQLDLVVAGGYAKNGCLAVVQQTIRPSVYTEFEMPGCDGVWALLDPSDVRKEQARRKKANEAMKKKNDRKAIQNEQRLVQRKKSVDEALEELRQHNLSIRKKKAKRGMKKKVDSEKTEKADGDDTAKVPAVTEENEAKDKPKQSPSGAASSDAAVPKEKGESESATDEGDKGDSVKEPSQEPGDDKSGDVEQPKEDKMDVDAGTAPKDAEKPDKSEDGATEDKEAGTDDDEQETEINDELVLQLQRQAEDTLPLEQEEPLEEGPSDESEMHSYMLLNSTGSTTVLTTAADLEEAAPGSTDFVLTEKTIASGNVYKNEAIVQVVSSKVRVLKEGRLQCEHLVEPGAPRIKRAQVSHPLVLLELDNKSIIVLRITAEQYTANVSEGLDDDEDDPFAISKDESSKQETFTSYRNFSIAVDFSEAAIILGEGTKVACASLYKGPLAEQISKDGIIIQGVDPTPGADAPTVTGDAATKTGEDDAKEADAETKGQEEKKEENKETMDIDDEDRLLYGDDDDEEDKLLYGDGDATDRGPTPTAGGAQADADLGTDAATTNATDGLTETPGPQTAPIPPEKGVLPLQLKANDSENGSHLLVVVTAEGSLMVLSSSLDYSVVMECPYMYAAPALVTDHPVPHTAAGKPGEFLPSALPEYCIDRVALAEVPESCLLPGLSNPYLIVVPRSNIPLIYQVYMSAKVPSQHPCRSRLTLRRVCFSDGTVHVFARSMKAAVGKGDIEKDQSLNDVLISVFPFSNISGRSGLFLGGSASAFMFAERGYPRVHEMCFSKQDRTPISREEYEAGLRVISVCEFHNRMCPRGFIYVGADQTVRIASLAPTSVMNFDCSAPFRKIALRCTPHKVAFHAGSATYGVIASMPTLTTREERLARILQSLEKHDKRHYMHTAAQAEAETGDNRTERVPPLFEELHELRVYRPDTWELIKSHKLEKGEVGLAICNMKVNMFKQKMAGSGLDIPSSNKDDDGNESLFAASTKLRPKDLLVVGTGHLNGEDASSRGRLLLFEISRQEVYTETGGGHTAFQLRVIAEKELFSPVTAVAPMEGYIIAGVGPQISVYKLVGDEIVHLSFAFGQLFCTCISTIKQYVMAADIWKSVTFMYFRERNNSVNFLGRDYETVATYANEFLIENDNMSVIVSDGSGNLRLLNYAHASVAESRGGKRLLLNGAMNFGSRVNKFLRVRVPDPAEKLHTGLARATAGQHALLFATLDGGVGAVVSVNQRVFEELQRLSDVLLEAEGLTRLGGVNMAEQVAFKEEGAPIEMLDQRITDSRLVYELFSLTVVEMRLLARKAGLDLDRVIELLLELDSSMYRF